MGLFDSVWAPCPTCGKPVEFQSKADCCPYMNNYGLEDAPTHIMIDVLNDPGYCHKCGNWMALVDPQYPPGRQSHPRPKPRAVKVRAPANPTTHPHGFRWWPEDRSFSYEDLIEGVP